MVVAIFASCCLMEGSRGAGVVLSMDMRTDSSLEVVAYCRFIDIDCISDGETWTRRKKKAV